MRMFLTALLCLPLISGCDGGEEVVEPTDTETPVVEITDAERADALWTAIDGFDTWGQIAPWNGIQFQSAGSPHGPSVQIWLNAEAEAGASVDSFADGAILVKRVYDDASDASAQPTIYAMEKIEGYGSTDWFWAVYDESGTANTLGDVAGCTGCHSSGSDYSRVVTDVPGTP
jgi:hypothetical protein